MIRRATTARATEVETPTPEYETIPVRTINIALVNGFGLTFQLETAHTIEKSDSQIVITQGDKTTEIARERVLYIEQHPGEIKRKKQAMGSDLRA